MQIIDLIEHRAAMTDHEFSQVQKLLNNLGEAATEAGMEVFSIKLTRDSTLRDVLNSLAALIEDIDQLDLDDKRQNRMMQALVSTMNTVQQLAAASQYREQSNKLERRELARLSAQVFFHTAAGVLCLAALAKLLLAS